MHKRLLISSWCVRSRMGIIQHRNLHLHPMFGRASRHGRAHQQGKAFEARPVGRLAGRTHERGGQHEGEAQIRGARPPLLPPTKTRRSTVTTRKLLTKIIVYIW